MKAIKKFIGLSLILVFSVSSIMAQKGEKRKDLDPTAHAQKRTERLAKELGLTPAQSDQVAEINLAYAEKIKAVKGQDLEKEAKRSTVKSLKTDQKSAIKDSKHRKVEKAVKKAKVEKATEELINLHRKKPNTRQTV